MVRPRIALSHDSHRRAAFTVLELVVIVAVFACAVAIVLPSARHCGCVGSFKDKTQISMVHKSCLTFAADNKGSMALPGLVRPRITNAWWPYSAAPSSGGIVEDFSQNT